MTFLFDWLREKSEDFVIGMSVDTSACALYREKDTHPKVIAGEIQWDGAAE